MGWAQFEEKEYEVAAAIELATGRGGAPVFASGQVLEGLLGYDAASDPHRTHPIWPLLRVARPDGLRLISEHWQLGRQPSSTALPRHPISLILQYKRPQHMVGATAKQWRMWRRPYLRFEVRRRQQRVLARLERELGGEAVVRYASPAFVDRGEFEAAQLAGDVLGRSGFVAPQTLVGHRYWTYIAPGVRGRANPAGRWRRMEPIEGLLRRPFVDALTTRDIEIYGGWRRHLTRLGEVARSRQPMLRRRLDEFAKSIDRSDTGLSPEQIRSVLDMAAFTTLTYDIGASWLVFDGSVAPMGGV